MKKALLFLACMGCFISCDNNSNKEQQAPNVKVIRAEQSDTSSERSYSFISQPYRTTELSFRVGGPVYTFDTQSGQFFRKGELIAAIDDRDFLIRKQRAEAIYKQTEADYKRISNLYEKGSIFCNCRRTGPGRAGNDPSSDDLREASDLQLSGNSGI